MRFAIYFFLIFFILTSGECRKKGSELEVMKLGGDFSLVDQDGNPFTLKNARGRVVLLFFGYTTCPDFCPATMAKIQKAYDILGLNKLRMHILFITLDPERDTPEKLKNYVKKFDFRVSALTGSREAIKKVIKKYGSFAQKRKVKSTLKYLIDHSSYIFLLDRKGRMRHIFKSEDKADFIAGKALILLINATGRD